MRALLFGVMSMDGTSKRTGAKYQISRLYVASEVGSRMTEAYTRRGAGYEAVEVELDPEALTAFLDLKYPGFYDVETEMRPMGGRFVPVAIGVKSKDAKETQAA